MQQNIIGDKNIFIRADSTSQLYIYIYSTKTIFDFEIKCESDCMNKVFRDLGNIFHTSFKNNYFYINSLQKKTKEISNKIDLFVEEYKTYNPQIYKLKKELSKLDVEEYFFIFLNNCKIELNQIEKINLGCQLESLNTGIDINSLNKKMDELFKFVMTNYTQHAANGERDWFFGEADPQKKVCRFCKLGIPDVKFSKKAHTISEALGNKHIITRDECDSCNEKFGNDIEKNLINFLSVLRVERNISGKKGTPKIKGDNFQLENKDGKVCLTLKNDILEKSITEIDLNHHEKIIEQDIYRAIIKFAIGIIPNKFLTSFQKTTEWILKKFDAEKLPYLAYKVSQDLYTVHPIISVYTRNNSNTDIPLAICELHIASLVVVAILPTFELEEQKFCNPIIYHYLWNKFFFSKSNGWNFCYLIDNNRKKFSQKIFIVKLEDEAI